MAQEPPIMRLPAEIRILIYDHLFEGPANRRICIENVPTEQIPGSCQPTRTTYPVLDRRLSRRSAESTYRCINSQRIHTALLGVSKRVHEEASHYLYSKHEFDFGSNLEGVVPFLQDKMPKTKALVQQVALQRDHIVRVPDSEACEWTNICQYFKTLAGIGKLRLSITTRIPRDNWAGPKKLSTSDLKFLYSTRHECLEWARQLAEVKTIREIEIVAKPRRGAIPVSPDMLILAAFSGSVETSLLGFLRDELDLPVKGGSSS